MAKAIVKLAAAVCAAALLAAPAGAESCVLPSGDTVESFAAELEEIKTSSAGKNGNTAFASAGVGVFKGGEVLYTGYFGFIDAEHHIPADENSVYEWGSISKTLVWVSAMQLWERGQLDLDRDIREYLPEGFFRHLSYDEPITFMDLMNHTAGWQETVRPVETKDEGAVLPLKDALQLCEPAQIFRPGEVTSYSNYGAALAGYIIECVSGTDYCEYVHRNILEPLGMERTSVNPAHSDNPWVAEQRKRLKSYLYDPLSDAMTDLGDRLSFIMPYPAGAVTGTLSDLMTYGQALVNDDAPLFADPKTQKLLLSATSFYGSSDIPKSCHGFWAEEHAVRVYGHSGATNSCQADLIFDPETKVGLAVMVNEPMGNVFLYRAPDLVFGSLTADRFADRIKGESVLSGYYLMSRSTHRGLFRSLPYLTALRLDENVYDIGDGVYLLSDGDSAQLLADSAEKTTLEYGSQELIRDDAYVAELALITLYFVSAAAALYFIRIRRKLKKHGRTEAYSGSAAMLAGDIAIPVSTVALLGSYAVYYAGSGGVDLAVGAVIGVLQMICAGVCAFSAVGGIAALVWGRVRTRPYRYVLNAALNIVCVSAVLYFEMYMFCGC